MDLRSQVTSDRQTRSQTFGNKGEQYGPRLQLSSSGAIGSLSGYDFFEQIGLSSYKHVMAGISCEQLIRMSQPELSRRILLRIPRSDVPTVEKAIVGLRECFSPAEAAVVLPEDFPDLRTYLKDNGIADVYISKLHDRGIDMCKFLRLPDQELIRDFGMFGMFSKNRMLLCRHNLLEMLQKFNNEKPVKLELSQGVTDAEVKELKAYLETIDQAQHFKFFKGKKLSSVLLLSMDQLKRLGMTELEATFFMLRKDKFAPQLAKPGESSYIKNSKSGDQLITNACPNPNSGPGLSADEFLKRHGITLPPVLQNNNPDHVLYAADIGNMNQSEIVKLALTMLDSYKTVVLEMADWKSQILEVVRLKDEAMDVDSDQEPLGVQAATKDVEGHVPKPISGTAPTSSIPIDSSSTGNNAFHVQKLLVEPRPAVNILLLGDSGVGKTTFINSFANYLKYETLTEARKNRMIVLIPTSFCQSDPNHVDHRITLRCDSEADDSGNERLGQKEIGQSSTQSCRSYVFTAKQGAIRIIDTPGINDVRGLDQDKLNFANILAYISRYPDLHAICILLHPNKSKITPEFRLCIYGLLKNLEKSASRNIIFVFTNARSTNYHPGDTSPILEEALREIAREPPHISIRFDMSTSFCVDNEGFRFLAAINSGLHFLESRFETYAESWTISVAGCKRLIEQILTLEPHKVRDTTSISEARRIIEELASPVADILMELTMNISRIMDQIHFLQQNQHSKESLDSLKAKLVTKVVEVEYKTLMYPRTVCASKKCISLDSSGEITFTQVCHNKCQLPFNSKMVGITGDPTLRQCEAFNFCGDNCIRCKCSWQEHQRITQEKVFREALKEDVEIKALIGNATTIKAAIEAVGCNLELYKAERRTLVEVMAFFISCQNANSITGRGDPFLDCLQYHKRMEQYKSSTGFQNQKTIQQLERLLTNYEKAKKNCFGGPSSGLTALTAENVFKQEKILYELPLHGSKLRELRETIQQSRVQDLLSTETVVDLRLGEEDGPVTSIFEPVLAFFARK